MIKLILDDEIILCARIKQHNNKIIATTIDNNALTIYESSNTAKINKAFSYLKDHIRNNDFVSVGKIKFQVDKCTLQY